MMATRPLVALLFALVIPVGCAVSSGGGGQATEQPKPNSGGEGASDSDPGGAADTPRDVTAARDATDLPDCPATEGRNAWFTYCNDAGKLVGEWRPVDVIRPPEDAVVIFSAEGPDTGRGSRLTLAVRGDELYILHVTCDRCRRVLGQGFVGRPALLSAEQRESVQAQLGVSEDVPNLESVAAWTEFASDERGQTMLTELASITEMHVGG